MICIGDGFCADDGCATNGCKLTEESVRDGLIQRFGLTERTDDYTDRPFADLWSGSGVSPTLSRPGEGSARVQNALGHRVEEVYEWSDGEYRIVWRVPCERLIVTYCEGDVSVLQARSESDWKAINHSAAAFYATY
jgi:hypothetical protein